MSTSSTSLSSFSSSSSSSSSSTLEVVDESKNPLFSKFRKFPIDHERSILLVWDEIKQRPRACLQLPNKQTKTSLIDILVK